jgi:hypothetical protein
LAKRRKRAESRARYFIREESYRRGWNLDHVSRGGDLVEEQEIADTFLDIGLDREKPDFIFCIGGQPEIVVEAKNEASKIEAAISEAQAYADTINSSGRYTIRISVGVAGEEDTGVVVQCSFLKADKWVPLRSHGYDLTNIPSRREAELALEANDGSTKVSIPSSAEFIDAAIDVSRILRTAKVEAPLRPKVIGALVLAMYEGDIDTDPLNALDSINELSEQAIRKARDLRTKKQNQLIDALNLSGADFNRLAPYVRRTTAILRRLNVRSVMNTDADFLGMFYEAFLRYGYDNNALGIVFTPRHITRFCVELIGVTPKDRVIDVASGTGGFLVSALDKMLVIARTPSQIDKVKNSLFGFDTNPTVWALSMLNMFFRGDGKSNIEHSSCFESGNRRAVAGRFTRAFLNPPFSQDEEPERDFIDAALAALEPGGQLAAVVPSGMLADDDHSKWRARLCKSHSVLAVISLPDDLFYPTASPTSILVVEAHQPLVDDADILMAHVENDGFEKLKNRRVERSGNQLPEVLAVYKDLRRGGTPTSSITTIVKGMQVCNGEELSPQEWLPHSNLSSSQVKLLESTVVRSVFQAVAAIPDLADQTIEDFCNTWRSLPPLPKRTRNRVSFFFDVQNGRSSGERNYQDGDTPYISSGDTTNSIIRLIGQEEGEVFVDGGLSVTAFGQAYLQPWPFMARGNGGSAVRVLFPRYAMGLEDLLWFAAQINAQRWRFFYARMAIKSRLERLEVISPNTSFPPSARSITERLRRFRLIFDRLTQA